jgi:hypothetical protein
MLNQMNDRSIVTGSDWCVGEPPVRWDVSFGARLAEKIKNLFWRDAGDRPVPVTTPKGEGAGLRKAA